MQCLPAGFSLAMLTPIKCSSTDRVARGAPLCTDANLFAGFSTQLMKVLLHTFSKPKKEHLEAQRVERIHTCLDQMQAGFSEDVYCSPGTCHQDHQSL